MRTVSNAEVPERKPGEEAEAFIRRICQVNGWPINARGPVREMPEGTRMPYPVAADEREPGAEG